MPRVLRTPGRDASRRAGKSPNARATPRARRLLVLPIEMMAALFVLAFVGLLVSAHQEPAAKPVKTGN